VIELGTWPVLPIFEHLQKLGNVAEEEMLRTFNMGLGMLIVVPAKKFKKAQTLLERAGEKFYSVGRIVKGDRKVCSARRFPVETRLAASPSPRPEPGKSRLYSRFSRSSFFSVSLCLCGE
jgi:hypothetical protein